MYQSSAELGEAGHLVIIDLEEGCKELRHVEMCCFFVCENDTQMMHLSVLLYWKLGVHVDPVIICEIPSTLSFVTK